MVASFICLGRTRLISTSDDPRGALIRGVADGLTVIVSFVRNISGA